MLVNICCNFASVLNQKDTLNVPIWNKWLTNTMNVKTSDGSLVDKICQMKWHSPKFYSHKRNRIFHISLKIKPCISTMNKKRDEWIHTFSCFMQFSFDFSYLWKISSNLSSERKTLNHTRFIFHVKLFESLNHVISWINFKNRKHQLLASHSELKFEFKKKNLTFLLEKSIFFFYCIINTQHT